MPRKQPQSAPHRERRATDVLGATERVLWPLVKLLLQRDVTYPTLADALKRVYVGVAMSEFPPLNARETDSRLSVLTGIYRRDIKRLRGRIGRELGPGADGANRRARVQRDRVPGGAAERIEPVAGISLASMVVAVWTGRPEYLDSAGSPKPLPRLARKGRRQSFESLVASVSKDVRPRVLLDEWLRRGAVELDADDRVHLNLDNFMAVKDLDEKAFYFALNVHDHIAAAAHNLVGGRPPFLERCAYYGRLTEASVAELSSLAGEAGMEALQAVSRRALTLQRRDAGNRRARHRMNFGVYFFSAAPRGGK